MFDDAMQKSAVKNIEFAEAANRKTKLNGSVSLKQRSRRLSLQYPCVSSIHYSPT